MRYKRYIGGALALLGIAAVLGGCGSGTPEDPPAAKPIPAEESIVSVPEPEQKTFPPREIEYMEAIFHEELSEGNDQVKLDLSSTEEGYFAVSCRSENRLKVQMLKDEETYTFDIASDGAPSVFPLPCGDGSYTVRVMENVEGTKYAELYSAAFDVVLNDEYQPFLRPNAYVPYERSSACVKKAAELAGGAETAPEVVSAVYAYICESIAYDAEKASNVSSGYMPAPDETLAEGRGICFDYASLAAAMLRSQGIPTKMIFGYVSPDGLYHAWNMFYTKESGWVAVGFEVSGNTWNRIDLTFSSGGADAEFIGDGSNYSDLYCY